MKDKSEEGEKNQKSNGLSKGRKEYNLNWEFSCQLYRVKDLLYTYVVLLLLSFVIINFLYAITVIFILSVNTCLC